MRYIAPPGPSDNILADVFDSWVETLNHDNRMTVNAHLSKVMRLDKMGPVSAKALLACIYVFVGAKG